MVKEPKTTKSFFWALFVKCFIIINYYSFMFITVCFNIWLEVYLGILKIGEKLKFIFIIKMAPSKFDRLNFGNS
jgi:hypothetical protein